MTSEKRPPLGLGVDDATRKIGAVLLPLGVVLFIVATAVFHPSGEHPMDNPAVFMEYARDDGWVGTHFAQWAAALFLAAGLVSVCYSLESRGGLGGAVARLGFVAALLTGAAFTMLQAVDGIALKWAVDEWAAAPPEEATAAFAAAESVRWTEYALQSYSNLLLGLTLLLISLGAVLSAAYPLWLNALASASGVAWIIHGSMVSYIGLFDSSPRLIAIVLLAAWSFIMAATAWRKKNG
jgi:hypothetical protein